MRLDSPFVLALAGTLAIHTLFIVGADAVTVLYPPGSSTPTPRIELVEVEVPPVLAPPPPPVQPPEPEPPPEPPPQETPRPQAIQPVQSDLPPPPTEPPPQEPVSDPGGAPTVSMPDIGPSATGVAVAPGPRNSGKVGRGGTGTGTGSGTGEGSGGEPLPAPVSIATIKTPARVKGDYGYIDLGKDYPAEARRLGIEGPIRVRLTVDDKGKVKAAVLLNKLGHGLDELALTSARQIEFEPARDTDDRAVASVVVWTFRMELPK